MNSSQRYFGPYQLQQRLGGNETREVWQVLDERRQDIVVVSILHVSAQEASELLPRFLYETKNLQSLRHPNIASILDVQVATRPATDVQPAGNDAYIVTRWVDGPSLANYMATTSHIGTFPTIANLHQMLAPIASALDYAHQNGIIHGYINPTSILLDARSATESSPGEPRIVNFGMHAMRPLLTLPLSDVCYISPEIAQGHTENTRSDLYSLGVILYELCTGTLPFQADSVADMLMQHIHATPMAPVLINPRIVPGLAAIIMHCLAKEPSARFPTASALVTALDRLMKSPASISLGLSNPGFSTGQQQALGSSRGLSGQQQALSLPPGSSLNLFSADQQQTLSSTPASGGSPSSNPASNPGTVPSPLAYGSAPVVSQYNQPSSAVSSASGPADDSSPTFLTPARNSMHIELTSAQTIISPLSSYAPAKKGAIGAPHPPAQPRRRMLPLLLTLIVVFLLIISGIVALFLYPINSGSTTSRPVFGHTFFTSSGLINQNNTNGIADGVQVELQNLPVPQSGKSYYAWLLADTDAASDAPPIALGGLTVHDGQATKTFVDPQNKDLLFKYSRFLVTEEDASTPPANPSLNTANWRYAALFSRVPNPDDLINHYSVLDHLRHLLAQDPTLKKAGLDGGLDTWLFRNTLKILEWSGSARDAYKTQDTDLIRRQSVRILDYLDNTQYVTTENIPSDLSPVLVDHVIGKVGMLQISQNQSPPGYLKHIGNHLREITGSTYATPVQRMTADKMNTALDNVQGWFTSVHADANRLIHMTPDQLQQPQTLTLLNTMFGLTNSAFVGKIDPSTNTIKEGVSQIHYESQSLATFDVLACSSSNVKNFCV